MGSASTYCLEMVEENKRLSIIARGKGARNQEEGMMLEDAIEIFLEKEKKIDPNLTRLQLMGLKLAFCAGAEFMLKQEIEANVKLSTRG